MSVMADTEDFAPVTIIHIVPGGSISKRDHRHRHLQLWERGKLDPR